MDVFKLLEEKEFRPEKHVEKILGSYHEGDVTAACWEPGQKSPYHAHHEATEIYFCFEGGGTMRTEKEVVDIIPGAFVVHPRGEYHEYTNGPERTLLFRVRYGDDMKSSNRDDQQAK
ncbi:cupin domain-containing protein [Pseudomonadota bacterium]